MRDRVIALAGLLQAVRLVQQMANTGEAETRPLGTCIDSLFRFDADTVDAVYGDVGALRSGLQRVIAQLEGDGRDPTQTRIAMNVLHLERRFVADASVGEALHADLEALAAQHAQDGPTHPALLERLGELYARRISPLGPRVMVQGNPVYLGQPAVVGDVRATLLAALRAAVLWRQLGGGWWDVLSARRRIVDEAQALLAAR
jgi:high frequency lysogenization protein